MKHFYGFLSNLISSIKLQSGNKTHPKGSGFLSIQNKLASNSRTYKLLALVTGVCLFSLLFWSIGSPEQFHQVRSAIGEEIKLTLSSEKQVEYTFNAPHQAWINEAGVSISSKKDLGRTAITVSHRAVKIDKRSSIRKVVGIHPEHDEDLDAEMLFTYTDAELNGLDETKLVLYSSNDNGVTWQPHSNGVTDPLTNTIHLGGIRHFSLWTAALQAIQGPGCVTTGIGAWWRSDNACSPTTWNDFSGNGYHVNGVNNPVFNTTGANFNPFVKLSGSYYHYTVGIFKNNPGIVNMKVFSVVVPVSGQFNVPWSEKTTNGHHTNLYAPWNNNHSYFDAPYGHRVLNNFVTAGGQFDVPNIVAGERTQNNMSIRTNGKVQNFPGSYGGTFTSNTNQNYVGAVSGYPSSGGAGLAEVIVYRDASSMTTTQVLKIESYLALKYGITLDQTTPKDYLAGDGSKMWDATVNGAFKFNIAGLGRDDCQSLHQKQSKSINPKQFITFATGSSIKADNASNTTAIIADNSYLTWADNGTSQTTTVAVGGTNVSDRMTRVWKVDKTNWTDQNITVKAAGYANRYLIIHNTSATFATAPNQEILLDANGQATFNSNLLPDGAFFSIGNIVKGPACLSAGIGAWWRADQECFGTSWVDYSGAGHNAVNAGAPSVQATGANYNPFVKFFSNHYQYDEGVFKNLPGIVNSKVFTVVVPVAGQYTEPWGEYTTNGHNYHFHGPHQNDHIYHDAPYGHRIYTNFTTQGGKYGIPNIIAGERTPTNMSIRTNGKVVNQAANYGGTFTSHTTLNYIGASHGLATSGGSGVAEVIVYRDASALTATDVQKIESYLALKYGITLDQTSATHYLASDGTKMWDATDNAAFRYNIAGLGRDDCQLLHQKQSKSVNAGQFIAMATGNSFATSNAGNLTSVSANNSYLTWGDNGNSITTMVAVSSSNVTDRMSRVWRVDKTNWTDQTITFQAQGYANRYLLIHNTSSSFASAPSQEILLDGTGSATFSTSLLPDGSYFTLGGVFQGPGCVNTGIGGWWRADQFCSSAEWKDFSGNDNTAKANGVPSFNTTGANFNPVVKFNGNNYQYPNGVFKSSPGIVNSKVFTVVMPINGAQNYPWGEYTTNGHNYWLLAPYVNNLTHHDAPWGYRVTNTFTTSGGQYGVPNIVGGERTQTNMSIRTNGKVQNFPGSYPGTFTSHTIYNYLGAHHGASSNSNSGVAEVIVYRDASSMTATQVLKIESYLALKYGITLDQTTAQDYLAGNGSKMWDAAANSTFKYNIAGLGRDNCQLLHQKQSKSVNPSQFITIALGDSIAASNTNNPQTITNDISFLVWGDDNGNRFNSTAITGSSNVTGRMNRVWRVDKTNWADQNITFKAAGYPNRYLLIHNTSASFASAPDQEFLLDGTGTVTFNSSLLPDGAYFTIGDALKGPGCVNAGVGAWWKSDFEMGATFWNDYSGNDKNARNQGSPSPQATGANFNPYVKFFSNHYRYDEGVFKNAPGIVNTKLFTVVIPLSGQYTEPWGEWMSNSQPYHIHAPHINGNMYHDAPYGHRIQAGFTAQGGQLGVPNIIAGERTQTNMSIRTNGKVVNQPGSYGGTFTANTDLNYIGAYHGLATSGGSGVAEVIVYRDASAMTTTDVQKIESYLALKYGITLDQTTARDYLAGDGTTKMWDAAANGAFKYNIAGLGRDNCQQLHQKQSLSVNPKQFITFALGDSIASSNNNNPKSVTADESFFVWADDNTSRFTTAAVSATNVTSRMTRVWKVDKTNWTDQTVTFKATGYPNRYLLIHNSSATFASAPDQEILLDGTGTATFNSSLLPDGAYFTIGDALLGPGCVNAGIGAWWKADFEMTGTYWNDYSGNDKNAKNAGSPTPYASGANFNPLVRFNSNHYSYDEGVFKDSPGIQNSMVFIANLPINGPGNYPWGEFTTNGHNYLFLAPYLDGHTYHDAPFGYRKTSHFTTNGGQFNVPNIIAGVRTQTNMSIRTNGKVQDFPGAYGGTFTSHTTSNHIGAHHGAASSGNTGLAEVIVYRDASAMTATDVQKIESYLALKYGITLDQSTARDYLASNGTTKMWDATVNAAYRYNIAGIGKDICQQLHQKQSRSINPKQFITFSLGDNIPVSNNTNLNSVTNDRSFFTWGDDDGTLEASISINASNVSERSGRIWRVDKTNWADQDITFQAQGYPGRTLLIDYDDATFSGVPDHEIELDGTGTATFSSSLLPDGAYFTLGNILVGPGCVNVGITGWFDASIMDEGLMVEGTGWQDKSGWHHHMYQIGAGREPAVSQSMVNFNKGAFFDGGDVVYQPSYTTGFTAGEAFAVGQSINNVTNRGPLFDFGGQAGAASHYVWSNASIYEAFGTTDRVGFIPSTNVITDNAPTLTTGGTAYDATRWNVYNVAATSSDWFAGMNGIPKATRTSNTVSFAGNGNIHIGWRESSLTYSNISEVVHYNRKLTAPERQRVHSYLALKYGITLDQTSPYDYVATNGSVYWDGTANAAFRYNIAGVGRDHCTNLNQKQSKSVNPSQFITIAVGNEIAASSAANAGTITNDRSFLVWSDDNGSATIPVAVTATNVTERMTRVWRVDKTNWADQNITFKAQGYPNRYLLIHNTSATFATAPDQEIALDTVGNATFNTSLLPDGAYFTIGDAVKGPGCVNLGSELWIRADYGVTSGASWIDYSGNDVVINQNVAGEQPAYISGDAATNFNPALLFAAGDNLNVGNVNGLLNSTAGTVVAAVMHNNVAASWGDLYNQNIDDPTFGKWHANGNFKIFDNGVHGVDDVPLTFITNRNHVAIYDYSNTANSYSGHLDGKTHNLTHGPAPSIEAGTAYIGGENTGETWLGNIYEMAIYNRELTAPELQRVNSYFAIKYGITLDQTTATDYLASDGSTKMWDATANATYRYNIAGLGRDNCSVVHQKQSRSANASQFITFAIGDSIATNNASNPEDITNDKSFLVWGDDGGSATTVVAVTAANVTERMTRVFRVDKTNWADQNLTFKAQGYANRYLIVSNSSATFATVDQEILLDANGQATFNSNLLPDGAYFTIGDALKGPGCVNLGVKLWFRPDYGVTLNTGTIANWADYSGNDVIVEQTTVARQPDFVNSMLNFNPGATFGGGTNGDVLTATLSSMNGNTPYTIFGVHKPDASAGNLFAIGAPATNQNIAYHPFVGGNRDLYHFNDDLIPGAYRSGWQLNTFRYDALASGNDRYVYDEGKQIGVNAAGVLNVPANPIFSLGGYDNRGAANGEEYDGDLVEFAVFSQVLDAAQRNRVESYFALKYGFTLDQTTPTDYVASNGTTKMWDATENTGFNNDIAGIARDNCQALYQKQSKSVNADALITMGNGGAIETSNADNGSTMDDQSFLVWGNNNGAVAWQTFESPVARLRLYREWRVDETGTVGTVKVQIPDNSSSLSSKLPGEATAVYLLVDEDGDFGVGSTEYPMTLNGTNWETDVDFEDGQYFTFATQVPASPGCVVLNLLLWLKADAGRTTAGNGVSNWADQSLSGFSADQLTVANQPTIDTAGMNFNPGLIFDNSNDNLQIANASLAGFPAGNASRTAFFVGKLNTNTGQDFAFGYGSGASNQSFEMGNNAGRAWYENWAGNYLGTVGAFYASRPIINSWNHDNAGSPNSKGYINGGVDWSPGIPALNTVIGADPLYIGRHNQAATPRYWDGRIGEVIIYDRTLTDVEMQRIHSYLAIKYGVTLVQDYLSGGGATIWDIGATGGYDNDIAGIGRDDCQALSQKQSKSVNTDALITIGNGNLIVGDNLANSSVFSADESFLLWGNNNGSIAWQLAEAPTDRQRLSREWRVYETGTIGSVKIRIPDNSSTLSSKLPGEVSTVYVLTDADGDFTTGATETAMTLSGTNWEADVDLSNGQYFTFSTHVPAAPGCVVANLAVWFDATKGVFSDAGVTPANNGTDNVQEWHEQTGNAAFTGNQPRETAAGDKPSYVTNGLNFNPVVSFGGANDRLRTPANINSDDIRDVNGKKGSVYIIANSTVAADNVFMDHGGTGAANFVVSSQRAALGQSVDLNYTADVGSQFRLVSGVRAGTGLLSIYLDGQANGTNTDDDVLAVNDLFVLGVNTAGGDDLVGNIAEVITYRDGHGAMDQQKIETYLAIKYGINLAHDYLSGSGVTIWDVGATGGYDNGIVGIGRDDCSGLEQKQSKSANTDALITIGNGNTIAATNGANSATFTFDKSFMLWGHNNGANAWQTTESPATRQRLTREWRIGETGTVGSVKIRVPDNSSVLSSKLPAETSTIYLLVDADGDFSSGATEIPMTANGTDWELNYELFDGDYITFATETCNPLITTNPVNVTLCAGGNATFTSAAFGSGLTYQWQENTGSSFVDIAGATSASYTKMATTSMMDGYQYRVIVSNGCPPAATSTAAIMTVNTAPAITVQPASVTLCDGTTATFEVTATGTGLSYQWQENSGSGFNDVVGETGFQFSTAATTAKDGYQYRVIVSGTCSPMVTSSEVTMTVNLMPTVDTHPAEQIVCAGEDAVFSVDATGAGLTYQWQEDTGSGFMDIAGATNASYTETSTTGAMSGNQYRVIVTGTCSPPAISNSALLTVNTLPAIITQPTAQTVCEGSDATFSVAATGTDLTYQWQENTGSGYADISGETGTSFTKTATTSSMNGYLYRVVVSGICTPPVTSNGVLLTVNTAPVITAQPSNTTVCAGVDAIFSTTATGTGLTYQWQENTGSGFLDISGATSASYTKTGTTPAMSGYQYRVIVSGTCPSPVTSSEVTMTVNALPAINEQPAAVTVCAGADATFTVTAIGTGLTYQWQENTGSGFSDISGATNATYTISPTTNAMNGYQYRVVVSGTCSPAITSNNVLLTVNALPAITTQPTAQTVCEGQNATFTVVATGTGLAYQWQENTGSGFANIAGAMSASYTKNTTTLAMSGYQYRVIVSGTCSPAVTSSEVSLTVNALPLITTQPSAVTVCAGSDATFTVVATGTGLTYQWQENTGSGYNDIAGATSDSYTKAATTSVMNGYLYRVVVTGTCSPTLTSNGVVLTVNTAPAITTQPSASTVCEGVNATFTVVATGTDLAYQWQEDAGSGFANIAGATSASYTKTGTAAAMNGYQYQVIVSGTCPSPVTSTPVTLTVNTAPAITTQPSAVTVCEGANATFTAAATGTDITYQWQENTGSGYNNIAGATSASYTKMATTTAMNGYLYRVIVSGTCPSPVTSNGVLLTVNALPVITMQPIAATACAGENAVYTVVATGTGLAYQWQENTGSGYANLAGETNSTLTRTAVTAGMNGYLYRVIVSGTCSPSVTSDGVSLTVQTSPSITTQPTSATVCASQNATFTVVATGTFVTYQWQENTGSSFVDIPGATNTSYTKVGTTPAMNGYQYRVVLSGPCLPLTSDAVLLTVNTAPAITSQPVSATVCAGNNATFGVAASGTGLTFQWEENTGSGWNNLPGETSTSFTKASVTPAMNGYQYRVTVAGTCTPAVTSSIVTLTVNSLPAISSHPNSVTLCEGNNAIFNVSASGSGLTYQWQENTGSGYSDIPGATASIFIKSSVTPSFNGYLYRVIVTGTCSPAVTSNAALLTVNSLPAITTHPASVTTCSGANVIFTTVATGSGLTYQWEENTGSGFNNISGATSASYTKTGITGAMDGYQYRVVVSGSCSPAVTSNAAVLTVTTAPTITDQPDDVSICSGANAVFSVTTTGSGVAYQWQVNDGFGFVDIPGAINSTYTKVAAPFSFNGYQYRVIVGGVCPPGITSDVATLTIEEGPSISDHPQSLVACVSSNASFSVVASGPGLSYQWQQNTGMGFVNISGATNDNYTKSGITLAMNGYQYRVLVTGTCAPTIASNPAVMTVEAPPAITTQPTSTAVCEGTDASFTVAASGTGLTYQWQENTGSGFNNISGATSATLTLSSVTFAMNGYTYRAIVTGACSPPATSNTVTLTVNQPPAITTQPADVAVCEGANAIFTVTATGAGLTYQWQENTGSNFVNIAGATGAGYTKTGVTGAMNGYQYRVIISGTCAPSVTSNPATLTANTPPAIVSQPSASTTCIGENAIFSVLATGSGLTYQWQENTGSGFNNIAGATSDIYTKTSVTPAMNGYSYRVIINGTCPPSVTSSTVALTVIAAPAITTQPVAVTLCAGANATFSVVATGDALTYQWQENTGSGFNNIAGATSTSYTKTSTTAAMNGYLYRVIVSGTCNPPATSNNALLTVNTSPSITTQPSATTVCEGADASFTVVATGTGLAYQWQEDAGSGFANIAGATSASYTKTATTNAMNGYQYQVIVSGTCAPPVTSTPVALTVNTLPAITTQPIAVTVCEGANATYSVVATGSGLTYQWQENTGSGFADISGATSTSYTKMATTSAMNGNQYRVIVSGSCSPAVTSNAAALTVNTAPSISSQPASVTVPESSDATFNVTASGTGLTYQWQEHAGVSFANIAGATSASYTKTAVTTAMDGYKYRVIISGTCPSPVTSDEAILTVTLTSPVLAVKAYLGAAYVVATDRMHDKLRVANMIPNAQPYNGADYSDFAYNGTETIGAGVLTVSGDNAIVDWVLLELRDANDPATIVARQAALIQRDGDVVSSTDGVSSVTFTGTPAGDYYVALRHRNHLAVMTMGSLSLSGLLTTIDFTSTSTSNYQLAGPNGSPHAQELRSNNKRSLWGGNYSKSNSTGNRLIYQGNDSDPDEVYYKVLLDLGNTNVLPNYIVVAYDRADGNLDGNVIFQGDDSDEEIPFFSVLLFPANTSGLPNFVVYQQIP